LAQRLARIIALPEIIYENQRRASVVVGWPYRSNNAKLTAEEVRDLMPHMNQNQ
jgi:hypothetical protein